MGERERWRENGAKRGKKEERRKTKENGDEERDKRNEKKEQGRKKRRREEKILLFLVASIHLVLIHTVVRTLIHPPTRNSFAGCLGTERDNLKEKKNRRKRQESY